MKYGYARVSTEGQHLEAQVAQLTQAGVDQIFKEKYTGTTTERPVFDTLLKTLQPHDMLVVTKLDRFARNTHEALEVMQHLFDQRVAIHILNLGLIDESPTGKLIFTIFSAFAQFERDLILTRTQEGKAYARRHNPHFREGRKETYSDMEILAAYQQHQNGLSYQQVAKKTGISASTLKRRIKKLRQADQNT
ncbi:recombinase family protein [Leuconostoc lactis]|uniref:Winged helix-turn-helix transcriptional regulator n=1 Tax=Leuconostoc lactis TaxID=1246 RepID=A0A6L7A781_LEULA|nr:recombinase family protein [Leuconostoc lactis]ANY11952.1 resolvase [Leuconostoc lactis]MWN21507.1 winged helix-turn-helix transcriptional regulator [Leuconostoc lactis]